MAANPYNVAITVFRNREWVQSFTVPNVADISRDTLRLVVLQGPNVVLTNKTPTVSSGSNSCTFVFVDADMGTLTANENDYSYQFLRKAYLAANSDLIQAGPLTVGESPVFPT